MTIKNFIDEYKNASNKDAFIQKHIITQYVTFSRKNVLCKQLAQKTTHAYITVDEVDKEVYKEDSVNRYILLMMLLIQLYTDIDMESMSYEDFSLLDEYAIPDKIHQNIPERECSQWETLLRMHLEDIRCNERDLVAWLDQRIDVARLSVKTLFDALANMQESDIDGNVENKV